MQLHIFGEIFVDLIWYFTVYMVMSSFAYDADFVFRLLRWVL